jgi:hypothetical protein
VPTPGWQTLAKHTTSIPFLSSFSSILPMPSARGNEKLMMKKRKRFFFEYSQRFVSLLPTAAAFFFSRK